MSNLVFLDWNGPEQKLDFIGWKSGRAENAFLDAAALVADAAGQRRALQLRLPFLKPASYQRDPFPELPPTRIEKFRLLPPPCRSTEREAKALLDFRKHGWNAVLPATKSFIPPTNWESVYGEVVYPTSADDDALRQRLKELKATHRAEYQARKAALANRTDPEAANEAVMLEQVYNAPAKRLGNHGPMTAGHLNVTLQMVKEGGNLLEQYLHQQWAARHKLDLNEMRQDSKLFLRKWAELTTSIIDSTPTAGGARLTTRIQNWAGWYEHEQLLQAMVAYRIHFADGSRFWLSGCQLRDLTTVDEKREIDELTSARTANDSQSFDSHSHATSQTFISIVRASDLTKRSSRWLRAECRRRGWKTSELSLEMVTALAQEAQRRTDNKSRVMRRKNESKMS